MDDSKQHIIQNQDENHEEPIPRSKVPMEAYRNPHHEAGVEEHEEDEELNGPEVLQKDLDDQTLNHSNSTTKHQTHNYNVNVEIPVQTQEPVHRVTESSDSLDLDNGPLTAKYEEKPRKVCTFYYEESKKSFMMPSREDLEGALPESVKLEDIESLLQMITFVLAEETHGKIATTKFQCIIISIATVLHIVAGITLLNILSYSDAYLVDDIIALLVLLLILAMAFYWTISRARLASSLKIEKVQRLIKTWNVAKYYRFGCSFRLKIEEDDYYAELIYYERFKLLHAPPAGFEVDNGKLVACPAIEPRRLTIGLAEQRLDKEERKRLTVHEDPIHEVDENSDLEGHTHGKGTAGMKSAHSQGSVENMGNSSKNLELPAMSRQASQNDAKGKNLTIPEKVGVMKAKNNKDSQDDLNVQKQQSFAENKPGEVSFAID